MSKQLSHKQKMGWFQLIVQRDDYLCFYCKETFNPYNPAEFEHLNNDKFDNRPENLVLCHHTCNIKKKTNTDWGILARQKLEDNERSTVGCERKADAEELTEMVISQTNRKFTETFLLEHTINGQSIILNDVVNAITNLCNDNNNTGSSPAIRRYIDVLTNPFNGNFVKERNPDGKLIIRRK